MRGSPIRTNVLSARILPNADPALLRQLQVPPGHTSLGLFTTDCDDVSYAALDEATKRARVQVAYARSMYAGAGQRQHGAGGRVYRDSVGGDGGGCAQRLGSRHPLCADRCLLLQRQRPGHGGVFCPLHLPDGQLSFQGGRAWRREPQWRISSPRRWRRWWGWTRR